VIQSYDRNYIIIFGIPGAGKGTIVRELMKEFKNIVQLSPGNLFRDHKKKKTIFYQEKVSHYLDNGLLIPSKTTNEMVKERIKQLTSEEVVIFDGYPRTLEQMQYIEDFLAFKKKINHSQISMDLIFDIVIDKAIAKRRIVDRRICVNCGTTFNLNIVKNLKICPVCKKDLILKKRVDDSPELYEKRYQWTVDEVFPVMKKYKQLAPKKYIEIHLEAETTPKEVELQIKKELLNRKISLIKNE